MSGKDFDGDSCYAISMCYSLMLCTSSLCYVIYYFHYFVLAFQMFSNTGG